MVSWPVWSTGHWFPAVIVLSMTFITTSSQLYKDLEWLQRTVQVGGNGFSTNLFKISTVGQNLFKLQLGFICSNCFKNVFSSNPYAYCLTVFSAMSDVYIWRYNCPSYVDGMFVFVIFIIITFFIYIALFSCKKWDLPFLKLHTLMCT